MLFNAAILRYCNAVTAQLAISNITFRQLKAYLMAFERIKWIADIGACELVSRCAQVIDDKVVKDGDSLGVDDDVNDQTVEVGKG